MLSGIIHCKQAKTKLISICSKAKKQPIFIWEIAQQLEEDYKIQICTYKHQCISYIKYMIIQSVDGNPVYVAYSLCIQRNMVVNINNNSKRLDV